jgi:hypothetical protein
VGRVSPPVKPKSFEQSYKIGDTGANRGGPSMPIFFDKTVHKYSIYIHICILKKEKYSLNEHMYSKLAQNHSSCSFSSPTHRPNGLNSLPDPPV